MKKRLLISMTLIILVVGLFSSIGLGAAKKTVTLWSFATNNLDEWKARKADVEKKFNINLNLQQVPEDAFLQRYQATLMDGRGCPDIIEWRIQDNRMLNADPKRATVQILDKYVAKSAAFKKVVPGRVGWVKAGGHVYGLPHDVHPAVLIYNDTIWKSVGVDLEKVNTWAEFFAAAQKLTAEKKDGKPLHYALPQQIGLAATMFMVWQQTGTQIMDKKGNPNLENAEFKAFVKQWIEWQKLGVMCDWDWGGTAGLLANGSLASYCTADWWITQVNTAAAAGKYQFKVRPLPYYKQGGPRTASWGGSFLAIGKLAKDQDLLYKIMEYMQYDASSIKTRYKTTGMIPPFASVWGDPMFKEADKRFGGQKLGELLVQMAKEMPTVNNGDYFWEAITDLGTEYPNMLSGKTTIEQGLKNAQTAVKRRMKR